MGARSEHVIKTESGEVRVLFTNRALADVEALTGKSILALANGFTDGSSGITEVAQVLRAGMEAARRDGNTGGKAVSIQDAYDVMDAAGFTTVATVVMAAVAEVIGYGSKNV